MDIFRKEHIWLWTALILASMAAMGLLIGRIIYAQHLRFVFLTWNLFLAWLPFLFAWIIYRTPRTLFILGPLWLLFLPNAPYLVTDLIHLSPQYGVPVWYDAFMLFTFALAGLLLGLMSLYLMQLLVAKRFGEWISWLFVLFVLGMSGFGVYIGRFLRWNSWDVFTQPQTLLYDILNSLFYVRTWTVTAVLAGIMVFAYLLFYALPKLQIPLVNQRGS